MRIPHDELIKLVPTLKVTSVETVCETLNTLGFETEILTGQSVVYDLHITPNRGDALSIFGIARELQAYTDRKKEKPRSTLTLTDQSLVDKLPDCALPVITSQSESCPQYHGIIIENVTIQPSPVWLQKAISLLDLRPINNVVDLTNYLMEMYGQPLHAFDLDAVLGQKINIRHAKDGETIKTLDGVERKLKKDALVAEDEKGLIDLVGIMGGANSAVDHRTQRIFLQSAIISPSAIKKAMAAVNHSSPASYRYSRGIDSQISLSVLNEAISLLKKKEFGGAKAVGKVIYKTIEPEKEIIKINPERVQRLLGTSINIKEQARLISLIGSQVEIKNDKIIATAPSWRFDLQFWEDYAEEIIRFMGIDEGIPVKKLSNPKDVFESTSELSWTEGVKDRLVELGFNEIMSYSFISKEDLGQFQLHKVGELANPLNPNLKYLRPSLLPCLANAIGRNTYFEPILLFEIGHVFTLKSEQVRLGIAIANQKDTIETWIARIADSFGMDSLDLESSLLISKLDKSVADYYKVRRLPVYLLEIPLEKLQTARRIPSQIKISSTVAHYKPISKFPPIARDIAVIIPNEMKSQLISDHISRFHPFVEYVSIFDEFTSSKLGENMKSVAFHVLYSSNEQTLNQIEIEEIEKELANSLENSFGAIIR